jgi:6-phosphogluconolactonase
MGFHVETLDSESYPSRAAEHIAAHLPEEGTVVVTGGTTAGRIYPWLARQQARWSQLEVFFSDERCVPPDDPASNYGMARELLLAPAGIERVHRMRGEDEPERAASAYHRDVAQGAGEGFDLVLLGMGADNHIGAMFPGSPALFERSRLCVAVTRPDGMDGLTLTPPALTTAKKILLLVSGRDKAAAVARALLGGDGVASCPVLLLAEHPDATFVLDSEASSKT